MLILLLVPPQWEGVKSVDSILALMVSVAANVIAYFVCKWLDRDP